MVATQFILPSAACVIPQGQVSYVCTQSKELLALREQVCSLRAMVAELGQLREAERFIDEAFRDIVQQFHLHCDSSHVAEEGESFGDIGHQSEKEENYP